MKFLLFIVLTTMVVTFYAQETKRPEIDGRAFNVYSQEEVAVMPASKIAQVNFLIRKSFIIPNEMKGKIDPDDVNGLEYNSFRKEKERVKVPVLVNREVKSQEYIILLSYEELDEAYRKIENKYN